MKKKLFLAFFCFLCFFSFAQKSPLRPDPFEWGDNPENYVGSTIILNAFSHPDNRYVPNLQETSSSGTQYCFKNFKEQKTGLKITVNIPQKFWDNNGSMIPKRMGYGLYQLTLIVTSEKPEAVCNSDYVSGSGSNNLFYILKSISRYNM